MKASLGGSSRAFLQLVHDGGTLRQTCLIISFFKVISLYVVSWSSSPLDKMISSDRGCMLTYLIPVHSPKGTGFKVMSRTIYDNSRPSVQSSSQQIS